MPEAPGPGEVHVHRLDLDEGPELPESVLSEEERARAARFHRPADRARAIGARAALRLLLGAFTGRPPASLRFVAGPHGKPALDGPASRDDVRFNVAHSGRLVLLAFAREEVGVDVEEVRPGVDVEALSRRFFSPAEAAALAEAPAGARELLFFRIWTRKEAYLKALGRGLGSPLDAFSTTGRSGAPCARLESPGEPAGYLADLEPGRGFAAAVVTLAPARVIFRPWTTLRA